MKARIVKDRLGWCGKSTAPQGYTIMRRFEYGPERSRAYGPSFLTKAAALEYCAKRGIKL